MWTVLAASLAALGIYLVLRPTLHALPQLKAAYARADTFWGKAFALAHKSATIVVTYVGAAIGFLLEQLDTIARVVGDPSFQEQVSKVLGADTRVLGVVMIGFSAIVFASRMRSIIKGV
ncbi:hypothetical protein [Bradyrhizobium sp. Ai1a-2]|uniref:hypothetical protein n=1 Tax=Bradyrhizobium sp. Ai1a-2 TaxID=196490 RepID=UPI000409F613|nr:hypothetical protein [Bradyrhizobium sp. Ai1a-2]